ncbi:hypothetical protein BACCIP111883_04221 [Sutcliffiella rhizosphaerae]|uniref:Uncharacterized protein n=1 Tax=Sutcliffiella rhizosphaerae TaxID=2880967 RepID=A0ABM8YTV9_9BACI|nr:hypothetical protein BACCIP111883_04221 [Sutcliffiella rhizosphaerae]
MKKKVKYIIIPISFLFIYILFSNGNKIQYARISG